MFSKALKFISAGVSAYRMYAIVVAIIASLSGAGWTGYQVASSKYKSDLVKGLEANLASYQKSVVEVQRINNELHEKEAAIEYITRDVIKEVKVYVKERPELNSCELDPAGLQLWNGETLGQ